MIQVALAPCSPFSVTESLMRDSGGARRPPRRAPAHPPRRDAGRGGLVPGALRLPAGRLSGAGRLARRPRLAGARHLVRRGRDRPPRPGQGRRQPLPDLEHDPGLGLLPGRQARGRRRPGRARRRRLGQQRQLEPDRDRAPRLPAAAPDARRRAGLAQGRPALGDARLGRLPRPRRHRRHRPRPAGRPRPVPPRRAALLRRRRPAGRPGPVRRHAAPTGSWSPAAGWSRTAPSPGSTSLPSSTPTAAPRPACCSPDHWTPRWPTPPQTIRRLPRAAPRRRDRASWPSWSRCRPTTRRATAPPTPRRPPSCSRAWASRSSGIPCRTSWCAPTA